LVYLLSQIDKSLITTAELKVYPFSYLRFPHLNPKFEMVNNVFYFINTTCCQGKALFITDAQAKYTNHVQDKQTTHVKVIILKYENAYSSITRVKVFFFFLVTCICLTMNQCYIFASICECVKLIQIRLSTCIHMKSKLLQTVSYKGKLVVK